MLKELIEQNTHKNPGLLCPWLAPNKVLGLDQELPYTKINYPCLLSTKVNGIRAIAIKGKWYSRAMKEMDWLSPSIQELFRPILESAEANSIVLDGEFHAYSVNKVGPTKSILSGTKPLPEDFFFKCFYCLPYNVWNGAIEVKAEEFSFVPGNTLELPSARFQTLPQKWISSFEEFMDEVDNIRYSNKEGLMVLNPNAFYKHNRATIPEGTLFKFKFYSDPIDAKITNLTSRQERNQGAIGRYNENLGKADTLHTQADFHDTDVAGMLVCQLEGNTRPSDKILVPFPVGVGFEERQEYFQAFGKGGAKDLKGTWLCFKRLACEDKDKPISIKNVQFRDDKD